MSFSNVSGSSGPISADWTESYQMKVEGLEEAEASFHMVGSNRDGKDPLVMNAYFNNFPPGTEVIVGESKKKVSDSGHLSMEIDMRAFMGKLPVDKASKAIDLGMEIEIRVPEREPLETELPEQKVAGDLAAAFARVRDRPGPRQAASASCRSKAPAEPANPRSPWPGCCPA